MYIHISKYCTLSWYKSDLIIRYSVVQKRRITTKLNRSFKIPASNGRKNRGLSNKFFPISIRIKFNRKTRFHRYSMTVTDPIPNGISNEIQIYSKEMFLQRGTSSAVLRVHPWRAPFNSYFASSPNGITLRNYASMFSRNFIVLGWCAKWPTLITGLCAFKCILFPSPPCHVEPFARKDHFSDWWHYYALVQLFLLPLLSVLFHPRRGWKKKERKKNDRCRDFVRFEIERSQFVTEREINR